MLCWRAWLCGIVAAVGSAQAHAAWPQPKGETLIISTLSIYQAKARFDALGRRSPAGDYRKQELSVYSVYGLTGELTLGVQPDFVSVRARPGPDKGRKTVNGLSNIEFFLRQQLFTSEGWVISAQGLIKLPGARPFEREPLLEKRSRDAEGRLLIGNSGRLGKHLLDLEYFSSIEAGYRARGKGASGQWRAGAAFGVRPWPAYQLVVQSFNIVSAKAPDDFDPDRYDLYKAQVSLIRSLPNGMAVQAGGYSEYAGRNIGAGSALFIALWARF